MISRIYRWVKKISGVRTSDKEYFTDLTEYIALMTIYCKENRDKYH